MAALRNKRRQPWSRRILKIILGTLSSETQILLESGKIIFLMCQKKLRIEWERNFLSRRNCKTESRIWAPCQNEMNFFRIHNPDVTPGSSGDILELKQGKSGNEWWHFHAEVGTSLIQSLKELNPKETSHMVTGVQEKIPFRSLGTTSGKQKKARVTSQPEFRIENTPATIETDKTLLVHQQSGATATSPTSTTTLINFPGCQSHSPQQNLHMTGNLRSLSCLKISSKQTSKFIISRLKTTVSNFAFCHEGVCFADIQKQ